MENKSKKGNRNTVILGVLCLLIGVAFNQYVLENTIILDREMAGRTSIFLTLGIQLVFIALGLFLILKRPNINLRISRGFSLAVGVAGIIVSVLLFPPIFSATLAMSDLLEGEITVLWIFALVLFVFAWVIVLYRGKRKDEISLLFLSIISLICIELATRLVVVCLMPATRLRLVKIANSTHMEYSLALGHPFFQFTNNPDFCLMDDSTGQSYSPFNKFGFIGSEYEYEKPENVIRIACLGGSTTAKGYPKKMEGFLNEWNTDDTYRFEVMNFGVGGYTTAHSTVNFVLNVIDFDPDYVVIHHAWNDCIVRNTESDFSSDYSHILKYFHDPVIFDRYPIRISIIYRFLKSKLSYDQPWEYLGTATLKKSPDDLMAAARKHNWKNLDELKPYRRNIKTITDFSLLRDIKTVLTTQPHSVRTAVPYSYVAPHIDQCNAIVRELRDEYVDKIIYVDLDTLMTNKMDEVFFDIAHMSEPGIAYKAEQIGKVIFEDWKTSKANPDPNEVNR